MNIEKLKEHYQRLKEFENEYYQKQTEISRLRGNDREFAQRGLTFIEQRCDLYIHNNSDIYEILNSQSTDIVDRTFKMDEFAGAFFIRDLTVLLEDIKSILDQQNE